MKEEIVAYFLAEKRAAMILLAVGSVALAAAIALIAAKSSYRAMAWPLALIAIGELMIGSVLVARTDGQLAALLDQFAKAPAGMAHAELNRMGRVTRNFEVVKVIELLVFAGGVFVAYRSRSSDFGFAIGVGLIAQSSLLLVFDLIAARRAERYVELLRTVAT